MRYVLDERVALRSWELVPRAYYVRGYRYARQLDRDSFDLLSKCDGVHDLAASELLDRLAAAGFVHAAAPGERWSQWSRPRRCDNRYFPNVNWAITGKCNLNCKHCFMAADNAPMLGEFSWEQCLDLIDGCEKCGIQNFTLTGGEPMLHPRFMDIVRQIARRGMSVVELNTNGYFLTADALDEFKALGLDTEIKISFDGTGHHDWLRGVPGAEARALDALKLAKAHGFRVRAQTNVHRGNLDAMFDTIATLDSIGVDEVRIIRTTETPRWRANGRDLTLGVTEYYDRMLTLIRRYVEHDLDIRLDIWQFVHIDPHSARYYFHPVQSPCSRYHAAIPVCKGTRGTVAISYTGELYPCNQMSGTFANMGVSFGNVMSTPLPQLLKRGDYLDLVTMPVSDILAANTVCQHCQYWKCCMGGCRAIALAFTGDYRHFDPAKCAFFKGGYMQKLDDLLQTAPRHFSCRSDTGDMARAGEPDRLDALSRYFPQMS